MRRAARVVVAAGGLLLLGGGGAYAYYFHHSAPEAPALTASPRRGTVRVGELERTFAFYAPARLGPGAPLVLALHGSMGDAEQMRRATAYGFELLADEHGFVVVYPEGYERHWNDCRKKGPYAAKRLGIDDVGFVRALVARFRESHGIDPSRVYAVGYSNGAHLAYRLALETPELVRAVAAVGANLPAPDNFDCTPAGGAPPVLIVNGTDDPINPYAGGKVTLFGFGDRGHVLSARESAERFAGIQGITAAPAAERMAGERPGKTSAERARWHSPGGAEVLLYTIHGGGHTVPQPRARFPRIFGRTHGELDATEEIWGFFARHGGER